MVTGDEAQAAYSVSNAAGDVTLSSGAASKAQPARVENLFKGDYIFTVTLPKGVLLTGLNGYPSLQRGQAQWMGSIKAGQDNVYQLELTNAAALSGELVDIPDGAALTVQGMRETRTVQVSGAYIVEELYPDEYHLALTLPEGEYVGDGWELSAADGMMIATLTVQAGHGQTVALPPLYARSKGQAAGLVLDKKDRPLADVAVSLINAAGDLAAQARTDHDGRWTMEGLEFGTYTVRYGMAAGQTISDAAVTLDQAQTSVELRAQAAEPATLKVHVFLDKNNNGTFTKYEEHMENIRVSLVTMADGAEQLAASGTTDKDGNVTLNAPAGTYTLRCTAPDGYGYGQQGGKVNSNNSIMEPSVSTQQDSQPLTLSTDKATEVGVGLVEMAALSGTAWMDENGDGVWQDEEPRLANVHVHALGIRNGLIYETDTAEDGSYYIGQIKPGTYDITYTVPAGYQFTIKAAKGGKKASVITGENSLSGTNRKTFEAGETISDQHIGAVVESGISGICFLDENYNGYFDEGEKRLSGVTLDLLRGNRSLEKVTSQADGSFHFSAVRAGTYKIKALLPEGTTYTCLAADWSGNRFAPRDGRREQTLDGVSVQTGQQVQLVVGAIRYGKISGVVYMDDDFSGQKEENERAVNGIVITLLDEQGNKLASQRTANNGRFNFENLTPGYYRLSMNAKAGYAFTRVGNGNVMGNKGAGAGETELLHVSLGLSMSNLGVGMILPGTVSGEVFADANDNGLRDGDEKGLAGTVVRLMDETGEVFSNTVTDTGKFLFDAVMPGRYYLRYELPENGVFPAIAKGGNAIVGEGNVGASDWFDFATGDKYQAPLCGGLMLSEISGVTFCDVDGDGVRGEAEALLPGVTFALTPSRAELSAQTAITGEDGAFAFTALRPDTYTLSITLPEPYVVSRLAGVTLPLQRGQSTQTVELTLRMGVTYADQQLGGVRPGTLSGEVWLDENNDGVRQADEAMMTGAQVSVISQESGDVVATIVSDENGALYDSGVAPGLYTLAFQLDENSLPTKAGSNMFVEQDGQMVLRDVLVRENETVSGILLGVVRKTQLGGLVWADHNGEIDPLPGAQVTLLNQEGEELASVTTGEDGRYQFGGLLPGAYLVDVTLPEGHAVVEPGDTRLTEQGLVSVMQDCRGLTATSAPIALRMDRPQLNLDIGSVQPGRLGDLCWLDLNGNGLQDIGESGIPGITVELWREGRCYATTVSDQYGFYRFENLYPAAYTLRVVWPAEVRPTILRDDFPNIVSILLEDGTTLPVRVKSDAANYSADLGFALVMEGQYPAGYGEGATQVWKKK